MPPSVLSESVLPRVAMRASWLTCSPMPEVLMIVQSVSVALVRIAIHAPFSPLSSITSRVNVELAQSASSIPTRFSSSRSREKVPCALLLTEIPTPLRRITLPRVQRGGTLEQLDPRPRVVLDHVGRAPDRGSVDREHAALAAVVHAVALERRSGATADRDPAHPAVRALVAAHGRGRLVVHPDPVPRVVLEHVAGDPTRRSTTMAMPLWRHAVIVLPSITGAARPVT